MNHEIGDGHFTCGEEGAKSRQKSKRNHESACKLNPSSDRTHCAGRHSMTTGRESKNFLPTVTGIQQTNNQPCDAKNRIRKSIERVHERSGCTKAIFSVKAVGAS